MLTLRGVILRLSKHRWNAIRHVSTTTNSILQELVRKGEFATAEKLRRRLEYDNVLQHPVYENAALDALNKDQLKEFLGWISLYPDRGHPLCPAKDILKATRIAVFERGYPRGLTGTIMGFGRICARKGLLDVVYDDIMRVFVGGMKNGLLVTFLVQLEDELPAAERARWRERGAQVLAKAGYWSAIVDLISRKRKGEFALSSEAYAKGLRGASGMGEVREVLNKVRERDWRRIARDGKQGVLGVERRKRRGEWEQQLTQRTVFKDPSLPSKGCDAVVKPRAAVPPPGVSYK